MLEDPAEVKAVGANNNIIGSANIQEQTYAWHKFKPSCFFGCFNMVLQLVLVGSFGSFLFGVNISVLNTAKSAINSSFLQCGPNIPFSLRFHGAPKEICLKSPECSNTCQVKRDWTECSIERLLYANLDHCKQNSYCSTHCLTNQNGNITVQQVRCPGGHNDISCPSLKWYDAFLSSAVLIGATIGALTGSRFLFIGRRTVLVVTMCIFVLGSICCTTSNSFSALFWGRLVVGYAVGLVSVASPTYMSEVTPKEKRGSYGVMHQLMIVIGICVPMPLGLLLKNPTEQDDYWTPDQFQEFWWRFMLAISIVPTLLAIYLLVRVYTFETPVWYVEQRRFKDAASLLELIHGKQDIREELNEVIQSVREGEIRKQNGMSFKSALSDSEYRWVIIVGIVLSAFQQFGGINVFMISSSDIFMKAGLGGKMQIVMTNVMAIINVIMTFPTLYLIERVGRRSLMLLGSTLQFVFVAPAAIMYWYDSGSMVTQVLAVVAVLGFVMSFALAYGPVLWVYLFEIYPMEIKDVAAGVATAVNWVSAVIVVFVAQVLDNRTSFTLFAVLQLIATVLIAALMKETRGRPLGDSPFITQNKKFSI